MVDSTKFCYCSETTLRSCGPLTYQSMVLGEATMQCDHLGNVLGSSILISYAVRPPTKGLCGSKHVMYLHQIYPNIIFSLCDMASQHFFSHPFPTRRYHPHTLPPKPMCNPEWLSTLRANRNHMKHSCGQALIHSPFCSRYQFLAREICHLPVTRSLIHSLAPLRKNVTHALSRLFSLTDSVNH